MKPKIIKVEFHDLEEGLFIRSFNCYICGEKLILPDLVLVDPEEEVGFALLNFKCYHCSSDGLKRADEKAANNIASELVEKLKNVSNEYKQRIINKIKGETE
jgi:hypothetical protein